MKVYEAFGSDNPKRDGGTKGGREEDTRAADIAAQIRQHAAALLEAGDSNLSREKLGAFPHERSLSGGEKNVDRDERMSSAEWELFKANLRGDLGDHEPDRDFQGENAEEARRRKGRRILGRGTYGAVECWRGPRGVDYAIKRLEKEAIANAGLEDQVALEIEVLKHCSHPNVVKYYGLLNMKDEILLVLEHCEKGDLYRAMKLRPGRRLDETETFKYFMQLVSAVTYLHEQGYIHRDLKLENMLLDSNDNLRLTDFGWVARRGQPNLGFCGTLDYLSPEMIQGRNQSARLDVWAVGVLLYEMLTGTPPFASTSLPKLIFNIQDLKIGAQSSSNSTSESIIKNDALDLVKAFLQPEPFKRLPLDRVTESAWVRRMISQIYSHYLNSARPISPSISEGKDETHADRLRFDFSKGREIPGSATNIEAACGMERLRLRTRRDTAP